MEEMKGSKNNLDAEFCTKVRLLDDAEFSCNFKKDTDGQYIFDEVCRYLDLAERDYFGLRFVDNNKQRHWLAMEKEVSKQLKNTRQPYMFFFRVKFYPTNPSKLQEEITRYQLFLQLKRDILHGRLLCSFTDIAELAGCIVQAEFGDHSPTEQSFDYLKEMKLLPRQTEKLEEKIEEVHKTLIGSNPAQAEERFLDKAKDMDLYGVDPHPCRDSNDAQLYLGLTPNGIQVIRDAKKVSGFSWVEVIKATYDGRSFYIQIFKDKKTNYTFRLADSSACKHLWKCTVEHIAFYNDDRPKARSPHKNALSPHNLFRRSKYRYSGKTERQLNAEGEVINRPQPSVERTPSMRMLKKQENRLSMPVIDGNHLLNTSRRSINTSAADDSSTRSDPMKPFETNEFPRDLTTDSSRSSMALDEEATTQGLSSSSSSSGGKNGDAINDLNHDNHKLSNHKTDGNDINQSNHHLSRDKETTQYTNIFFIFMLLAVICAFLAVFLEKEYGLLSQTRQFLPALI